MTDSKTHYRKAFDSPYLSSADIVEPTVLTIARATLESDKTKKTKDVFNTAYFEDHSSVPRKLISCSLRSPRPCVTTIKPCQLNPQVMNPITSASIAAFLAVPEILGIALKGIFFCGHLFTFALSRLTGRFDFTPALPVLFG